MPSSTPFRIHRKRTINSNEQFDFCKDLVEKVPDVADVPSTSSAPTTIRRRGPAKDKDDSERPAKKPRVYKKKVKKEDEDDDLVTEDEDEGEGGSGAKYEDEEEEEEEKFRPGSGSVPIGNMMMSSNTSADYEEATLPNFNGGGMIRHSSNYIPPGGPPSVPSFSNQNNWGQRSSSSSSSFTSNHQAQHTFLNPAASSQIPPQPSSASWGSTPSPTKPLAPKAPTSVGFGAASSTVWAPKTGGLPPPRFAPGGGEK